MQKMSNCYASMILKSILAGFWGISLHTGIPCIIFLHWLPVWNIEVCQCTLHTGIPTWIFIMYGCLKLLWVPLFVQFWRAGEVEPQPHRALCMRILVRRSYWLNRRIPDKSQVSKFRTASSMKEEKISNSFWHSWWLPCGKSKHIQKSGPNHWCNLYTKEGVRIRRTLRPTEASAWRVPPSNFSRA